jgi:hypothetical protein
MSFWGQRNSWYRFRRPSPDRDLPMMQRGPAEEAVPTPCHSVWQLAVHPIIKYVTLSQPQPNPPPQKKHNKILTKHKFNMRQHIQNVIYKSTLFQSITLLINLSLNSFPVRVSLVRWINESAVFHGDVRRSILIENIDLSSKGHIFASTVLFCYRQG